MTKKFFSILFLLSIGNSLCAMENIKLPSSEQIRANFFECFPQDQNWVRYFMEKTSLDTYLGNQELCASDVAGIVEQRVNRYIDDSVAQERGFGYDACMDENAYIARTKRDLTQLILKCILPD